MGPYAMEVTVYLYPGTNTNPFGHVGVGVNGGDSRGYYANDSASRPGLALSADTTGTFRYDAANNTPPIGSIVYQVTADQAAAVQDALNSPTPSRYNFYNDNCATKAGDVLSQYGVPARRTPFPNIMVPR
jgi:hypothetical protein